ncbi:hypothetical protein B0O99DRAFT_630258 [Bisporella sp. PMI_857]|nr:hypothetical protein B0O99DRAFT_630258 [Bisporella sp. PMI_857]
MDFLNKAKQTLSGAGSSNSANTGNNQQNPPAQGGQAPTDQKQDYGDKAFDFISKKTGHDFAPGTDEKITDGARTAYEKFTGKKVDPKWSN